ncbi:MAG: DUF4349 domain-containing protein [Anaerolineae bacterium]
MQGKRWLLALSLLVTIALVVACSPQRSMGTSSVSEDRMPQATAAAPRVDEAAKGRSPGTSVSSDASLSAATAPQLMIIRTVYMTVIMDDVEKGALDLASLVTTYQGYVADSKLWREKDLTYASITLRLPAESLDLLLSIIRGKAVRIESENITTADVSQEYVDLDSRLRNLQATEKELVELLATIRERTSKAEEVLAIYREITTIRGEIEQIQGRQKYLENLASLATVQVEIRPAATPPVVVQEGKWNPMVIVNTALGGLVDILRGIYEVLVVIVLNVVPVLIIIALPIVIVVLIVRAAIRRKARKQHKTPTV